MTTKSITELPKQHKKKILKFCKKYESLCVPRKLRITIPKAQFVVKICWDSDDKISIYDSEHIPDCETFFYKSEEITKINKKIKKFIRKTQDWGKKHFNDKDWIWHVVLWDYRPESGETIKDVNVKWVDDYVL